MGALIALAVIIAVAVGSKRANAAPGGGGGSGPIGVGPTSTFVDGNGVAWTVQQAMGTPGTDVWSGVSTRYGGQKVVRAPTREILQQNIAAFALVNKPSGVVNSSDTGGGAIPGGGVPGGGSDVSACGPYPPLVNGWRPVCIEAEHLGAGTVIPMSTRVETTVQMGAKRLADSSDMARIEAVVTGGDAASGYDLAFLGVVKQTNSSQSPLLSTVFRGVRPVFINRIVPVGDVPPPGGVPSIPSADPSSLPAPPEIPGGGFPLPPLPAIPTGSGSMLGLGGEAGALSGIQVLPTVDGTTAYYVWTRSNKGPSAPLGFDIVVYARNGRVNVAARPTLGEWSFYYADYLIATVLNRRFGTDIVDATVSASGRPESPTAVEGNEVAVVPSGEQERRAIRFDVNGPLEQVTFAAYNPLGAPLAVQSWNFRQLASWLF